MVVVWWDVEDLRWGVFKCWLHHLDQRPEDPILGISARMPGQHFLPLSEGYSECVITSCCVFRGHGAA
jgi:hypothetical protein